MVLFQKQRGLRRRWHGRCAHADEPLPGASPLHHSEPRIRSGRSRPRLVSVERRARPHDEDQRDGDGLRQAMAQRCCRGSISAALLFYVFGYATELGPPVAGARGRRRAALPALRDRRPARVLHRAGPGSRRSRCAASSPTCRSRRCSRSAAARSSRARSATRSRTRPTCSGSMQLCGGRLDAVIASALIPGICHFFVMLVQMTIALPFQRRERDGGVRRASRSPRASCGRSCAAGVASVVAGARRGGCDSPRIAAVAAWLERFPPRQIAPFLVGFAALAVFDIHIQWLASRAFGVPLDWSALAARLPLVYLSFVIPTLGNFGTRELTWAALFGEFGGARRADRLRVLGQRDLPRDQRPARRHVPLARAPADRRGPARPARGRVDSRPAAPGPHRSVGRIASSCGHGLGGRRRRVRIGFPARFPSSSGDRPWRERARPPSSSGNAS